MGTDPRSGGFVGRVYRQSHPDHHDLNETLASSRRVGGRFNPKDGFGVVYLAMDRETAIRELIRRARLTGVRLEDLRPRALFAVDLELRHILDLTNERIRADWLLEISDVKADDWTYCQEVGALARDEGLEAILYPSATCSGRNLAVFLDRLHPGSTIEVGDPEPLDLESLQSWDS